MTALGYRKPICMVGLCHTFRFASDEGGCWGECCICNKRVGYVDRATLRRACDAEALAAISTPSPVTNEGAGR